MKRGEIWRVTFDPQVGSEIRKERPAIIISDDNLEAQKLRVVVPLTSWQPKFASWHWMVGIKPDGTNRLSNESAANALQVKSVSTERFVERVGALSAEDMEDVVAAVAIVIGL